MAYATLDVARGADGVATLTLNRPDKLNSLTAGMHAELAAALAELAADDEVRCLLLTGAGRAFCTGQDLGERAAAVADDAAGPPDLGESLAQRYNPLVRTLTGMAKPAVCAVNGVAAGAGANLALACDIVLAARSAKFIQAFCRVGLIPDTGGTWILPRQVGLARAKGLALLGDELPAETAADWGLIWACVDDEALMDEAHGIAARLAAGPTRGLALTKRALNAAPGNDLDSQLELERELQREAGASADYREGVRAFLAKRKPAFRGR